VCCDALATALVCAQIKAAGELRVAQAGHCMLCVCVKPPTPKNGPKIGERKN
jgi:hypothetical protein